jgi:hypothetical protein
MVAMNSIGRYRLVRRIGAGSFATVDDDLDVPVAVQPPQESSSGSYVSSGNPYPTSRLTTRPPNALTPSRSVSYYVLLGVSALALFAISMFLTNLVLR